MSDYIYIPFLFKDSDYIWKQVLTTLGQILYVDSSNELFLTPLQCSE